jgi:multidrug efflux pump subunit AcrA (membrane-fusion protein)
MARSIRSIFSLSLVLAAASLAAACDKSGAEAQAEADKAQNKANAEIAQAGNQVTLTGAQAQAAADTKIAAAQADFAATREDYRHKVQSNIDALNKQLDDLDIKAKTAKGTMATDLRATVPALRAERDAFITDFQTLGTVNAVTWDAMRARLDKEWADLKVAVDKAD